MTARCVAVLAALFAAAPLVAQSTNGVAPSTTNTPAPTGPVVGPPQLRDFNLNGTVTQPAQTPTPAPSQPTTTTTTPSATPAPAPSRSAPREAAVTAPERQPAPRATQVTRDAAPTPAPSAIDQPLPDTAAPAPAPAIVPTLPVDAPQIAPTEAKGAGWWPWAAALLALILGGAFLRWRKQSSENTRYASDRGDIGALLRSPAPTPAPTPAPLPRTPPEPRTTVPVQPVAEPGVPPPPPEPVGIVASRLKPKIEFELVPVSAEVDAAAGARLTVDIVIVNSGSAPARDVLVEGRLINAGPNVDSEVGMFFQRPAGPGERIDMIPPMGRVAVRTVIGAPGSDIAPLSIAGRQLLVPIVALNADYRWSGGSLKDSSSFLIGRGSVANDKLAPFRLDTGARSWSSLAARLHSTGLSA